MKIIFVEEAAGGKADAEHTFSKSPIVIGRDAAECDIAFAREQFPMVSRRHAEIIFESGGWAIRDTGSTYGTFVGDAPVAGLVALKIGDVVRFGVHGPTFRIKAMVGDIPADTSAFFVVRTSDGRAVELREGETWLGRDPSCDVVLDQNAGIVSRRHAVIRTMAGRILISDNNSFNGTFVNEERISGETLLKVGDRIRLGLGGPIVSVDVSGIAPQTAAASEGDGKTAVFKFDRKNERNRASATPEHVATHRLDAGSELIIGRSQSCAIRLDGLHISKRHARISRTNDRVVIEDLSSANGVFVNDEKIAHREITPADTVFIDPFQLRIDAGAGNVNVFDMRSRTRVDVDNVSFVVRPARRRQAKLIDSVSFAVGPNEFVGILGPSGSGKSTLLELMNGWRRASSGAVSVNGRDVRRHFDELKHSIGYVPQDDIIHRELSVAKTLNYVARLRLAGDASGSELTQLVDEVLDLTGLADSRAVRISDLSGGQRKRVSAAIELLTKPSLIFLDEPTAGLDPAAERQMTQLFRELADSGRTVVMTTHSMENVNAFDKIALLAAGKLAFFGTPAEAVKHFGTGDFSAVFDILSIGQPEAIAQLFPQPDKIRSDSDPRPQAQQPRRRRLGIIGSIRQFFILLSRYAAIFFSDKLNVLVLLVQAPVIALLTFAAVEPLRPRDFIYFVLAIVAFWFGISLSARELIRERAVYRRERKFNLGLLPYLGSKLTLLGIVVAIQCLLLFVPLKILDAAGTFSMPGELFGFPQIWTMFLTAVVGMAGGLFISAIVRTPAMAASIVPLVLIPQILLSGIMGLPHGAGRVAGLIMPSAWSFDAMKQFSGLDTLEAEGSDPAGATRGLGLYRSIEVENQKSAEKMRRDLESIRLRANEGLEPGAAASLALPKEPEIKTIPTDLSRYISFLHPWMNPLLNQIVLVLMFSLLVIATLAALRMRDR